MPDSGKISKAEIDVSVNGLVPKHEVMAKADEDKLLADWKIEKNQLPRIKVNDPQCKRLEAKVGDVVKITRTDMGDNVYYRRVVK